MVRYWRKIIENGVAKSLLRHWLIERRLRVRGRGRGQGTPLVERPEIVRCGGNDSVSKSRKLVGGSLQRRHVTILSGELTARQVFAAQME